MVCGVWWFEEDEGRVDCAERGWRVKGVVEMIDCEKLEHKEILVP
jgi:hypothetical protein